MRNFVPKHIGLMSAMKKTRPTAHLELRRGSIEDPDRSQWAFTGVTFSENQSQFQNDALDTKVIKLQNGLATVLGQGGYLIY